MLSSSIIAIILSAAAVSAQETLPDEFPSISLEIPTEILTEIPTDLLSSLSAAISTEIPSASSVPSISVPSISIPTVSIPTVSVPSSTPKTTAGASPYANCDTSKLQSCAMSAATAMQGLDINCIQQLTNINPSSITPNSTINVPTCACGLFTSIQSCYEGVCPAAAADIKKSVPACFNKSGAAGVAAGSFLGVVGAVAAALVMF
ncbi:hypothetical protein HDU67_008983 [Dinochytrium kinnereticum]|nr:hypothetical protein HDU67_008983 [Dinochytrium kinnereticum]